MVNVLMVNASKFNILMVNASMVNDSMVNISIFNVIMVNVSMENVSMVFRRKMFVKQNSIYGVIYFILAPLGIVHTGW